MEYQKGQQFVLKQHHGYFPERLHDDPQYEAWLDRHHPLFEGQVGTVEEVVPANVSGAGNNEEDHVVLSFDHHQLLSSYDEMKNDPNHEPRREPVEGRSRFVSFTQEQMDTLFEPAPPQNQEVVA